MYPSIITKGAFSINLTTSLQSLFALRNQDWSQVSFPFKTWNRHSLAAVKQHLLNVVKNIRDFLVKYHGMFWSTSHSKAVLNIILLLSNSWLLQVTNFSLKSQPVKLLWTNISSGVKKLLSQGRETTQSFRYLAELVSGSSPRFGSLFTTWKSNEDWGPCNIGV